MKKIISVFILICVSFFSFGVVTILPTTLDTGYCQHNYYKIITASGSVAPYHFTVSTGSLPNGLILDSLSGQLQGSISSTRDTSITFTIKARSTKVSVSGTRSYTFFIRNKRLTKAQLTQIWSRTNAPPTYSEVYDTYFNSVNTSMGVGFTGTGTIGNYAKFNGIHSVNDANLKDVARNVELITGKQLTGSDTTQGLLKFNSDGSADIYSGVLKNRKSNIHLSNTQLSLLKTSTFGDKIVTAVLDSQKITLAVIIGDAGGAFILDTNALNITSKAYNISTTTNFSHSIGGNKSVSIAGTNTITTTGNTLLNGGNIGVGITPTAKFHIKGSGSTSATFAQKIVNSDGDIIAVFRNDYSTGIGILNPDATLHIQNGDATTTGVIISANYNSSPLAGSRPILSFQRGSSVSGLWQQGVNFNVSDDNDFTFRYGATNLGYTLRFIGNLSTGENKVCIGAANLDALLAPNASLDVRGFDNTYAKLGFSVESTNGGVSLVSRFKVHNDGTISIPSTKSFADNTAALAGGLLAGDIYYTDVAGEYILKIVH